MRSAQNQGVQNKTDPRHRSVLKCSEGQGCATPKSIVVAGDEVEDGADNKADGRGRNGSKSKAFVQQN